MDQKKYDKIKDFLFAWGYKPDELNGYIKGVAPGLANGTAQKARNERANAFFNELLGRAKAPGKVTKIPKPEDANEKGLAYDLWLMLGLGNDAISIEDLADFMTERTARIEQQKAQEAEGEKMAMSNMLRGLNAHEREENAAFIAEITERAERIRKQNTNMSDLLRNLHTQADSTPHTLRFDDSAAKDNHMNNQLRGLNADKRA